MYYGTYAIETLTPLHAFLKSKKSEAPCDMEYTGDKLVRSKEALGKEIFRSKPINSEGEAFRLYVKVCFDSSKRFRLLSTKESLAKFLEMSGLEGVYSEEHKPSSQVVPEQYISLSQSDLNGKYGNKLKLCNVFRIQGYFKVVDETKWLKTYNEGIGSRKTYGHGMVYVL